jgi:hypothetical protein
MAITYNEAGVTYDDPAYTYEGASLATSLPPDAPIHIIAIAAAVALSSSAPATHLRSIAPAPTTLPTMRLQVTP